MDDKLEQSKRSNGRGQGILMQNQPPDVPFRFA
jgi:hypothetical protein